MLIQLLILFFITSLSKGCNNYVSFINYFNAKNEYTANSCQISDCDINIKSENTQMQEFRRSFRYRFVFKECLVLIINKVPDQRLIKNNFQEENNENYKIYQLFLNRTNINYLERGAFNYLDKLQKIDLQNNNITEINDGVFKALYNLRILNLNNNQIKSIEKFSFEDLTKLIYLDLSFNKLQQLPEEIFKSLINLETLNITNNPFKILNFNLHQIQNFSASNISVTNLKMQSSGIVLFKSYINLNVSFSINCTNLKFLDLSYNNITNFSSGVFHDMNNLTILDLSVNKLTTIQFGLFDSLNLIYLNLSHNEIEQFNFIHVNNIHNNNFKMLDLDLSFNKLSKLNVETLDNVKKISLDNNKWQCANLIEIIKKFKTMNVYIESGNERINENIHKISCDNTKFVDFIENNKQKTNDLQINYDNINSQIDKIFLKINDNINNLKLFEFFDESFKNSSFYKFFTTFNQTILKTENNSNLNNIIELLEKINKNLENINLSTSNKTEFENIENDIKHSNLINFLNQDFNDNSFVHFLNNFENTNYRIRNSIDKPEIGKLMSTTNNQNVNLKGLYVVSYLILFALLVIILLLACFVKLALKLKISGSVQSEMELL